MLEEELFKERFIQLIADKLALGWCKKLPEDSPDFVGHVFQQQRIFFFLNGGHQIL